MPRISAAPGRPVSSGSSEKHLKVPAGQWTPVEVERGGQHHVDALADGLGGEQPPEPLDQFLVHIAPRAEAEGSRTEVRRSSHAWPRTRRARPRSPSPTSPIPGSPAVRQVGRSR